MKAIGTPLSKEELLKIKGGGPLDDCLDGCYDDFLDCYHATNDPDIRHQCFVMNTKCDLACYVQ